MNNIFEPHAGFKGMLTPPFPPISLLSSVWVVIWWFEYYCPLKPPWSQHRPILNSGVRGGILRRKVRIYCPCTVLLARAQDLKEEWRQKLKDN